MDLKNRERLLIVLVAVCIGAFLGDRLIITKLRTLWKDRAGRIAGLQEKIFNGQALLDREEAIEERWKEMRQQALPADKSVAENMVLQAMSRWTQASRFTVTSLKPRWIEEESEDYRTLECRVAAQGRLESLARFLYELERDTLPLRLEEVEVTSRDERGQSLTLAMRFSALVITGEK